MVTPSRDDRDDRLEHLLHHQRREPHRRLVEQQQAAAATSARGPSRASAARRPTACRRSGGAAPRRRGNSANTRSTSAAIAARVVARVRAHREVLVDGQRAEHAASFGHHREAAAHQRERRLPGDVARPRSARCPPSTGSRPQMPFSVVVLPAPFAPIRHTSSPSPTSRSMPLHRLDAAVGDLRARARRAAARSAPRHAARLAGSATTSPPRYAAITFGSFCTSRGGAFGDLLAVVEHQHAVAHAHHQLHVVLDQQDRRAVARGCARAARAASRVSVAFMPAAGSSSARSFGSVASARAISSRRWSP